MKIEKLRSKLWIRNGDVMSMTFNQLADAMSVKPFVRSDKRFAKQKENLETTEQQQPVEKKKTPKELAKEGRILKKLAKQSQKTAKGMKNATRDKKRKRDFDRPRDGNGMPNGSGGFPQVPNGGGYGAPGERNAPMPMMHSRPMGVGQGIFIPRGPGMEMSSGQLPLPPRPPFLSCHPGVPHWEPANPNQEPVGDKSGLFGYRLPERPFVGAALAKYPGSVPVLRKDDQARRAGETCQTSIVPGKKSEKSKFDFFNLGGDLDVSSDSD